MYSKEYRNKVQSSIITFAKADVRIIDCAIVGSESIEKNDEWSDIDLTFGVSAEAEIPKILLGWNELMAKNFKANVLFDLAFRESIYRVYLLPNALQVDLSFTPTEHFGAITEKFKLIFGKEKARNSKPIPKLKTIFGYAVLYALKTRCSIEREKFWQAHYLLEKFKENIMTMKCLSENLNPFDGRDYDNLSELFLAQIESSLIDSPNRNNLDKSLMVLTKVLISETKNNSRLNYKFENELKQIAKINTVHSRVDGSDPSKS